MAGNCHSFLIMLKLHLMWMLPATEYPPKSLTLLTKYLTKAPTFFSRENIWVMNVELARTAHTARTRRLDILVQYVFYLAHLQEAVLEGHQPTVYCVFTCNFLSLEVSDISAVALKTSTKIPHDVAAFDIIRTMIGMMVWLSKIILQTIVLKINCYEISCIFLHSPACFFSLYWLIKYYGGIPNCKTILFQTCKNLKLVNRFFV